MQAPGRVAMKTHLFPQTLTNGERIWVGNAKHDGAPHSCNLYSPPEGLFPEQPHWDSIPSMEKGVLGFNDTIPGMYRHHPCWLN